MEFTDYAGRTIEKIALTYRDVPYTNTFNCLDFVRAVYARAGLTAPPSKLNIVHEQLADPPVGYVIFLRHKQASAERKATHVGIIISSRRVIHCSFYFGKKVVITDIDELLKTYDLTVI
jgi:cell wall-associated NlpC family hydrolase